MGSTSSSIVPALEEFHAVHPREPGDKCLGDGTDAIPSTVFGQLVKLSFDGKSLTNIYTSDGNNSAEYAGGMQLRRGLSSGGMRVSLLDGEGKAIAACLRMQYSWSFQGVLKFKVYGTKLRFQAQKPSKEQKGLHGGPLYAWAIINEKAGAYNSKSIMKMLDKEADDSNNTSTASNKTYFRSEEVPGPTGPQTVVWRGDQPAAVVKKDSNCWKSSNVKWELTIAPGIDPCLILCLIMTLYQCERKRKNEIKWVF